MNPLLLGPLMDIGGKLIERIFPDQNAQNQAKLELLKLQQSGELQQLVSTAEIVKTEAASSHWLAANWRPITMLTFLSLIVARWFGWSAPGLTEAEYLALWSLMEIGIGGYVAGRSLEKIADKAAATAEAIKTKNRAVG